MSLKKKETGLVSDFREHIVSNDCEATSWNGKLHATLLIICVTNVTKYYFLQSWLFQWYAKKTSIFINFISRDKEKNTNKPNQQK